MRVTCIENVPVVLADHQRGRAAELESAYSLTVGRSYAVVGMAIVERSFYFLVRDDDGGPCFAYAGFFELFTAPLPAGWRFALETGIRASGRDLWSAPNVAIWGYPELVEDPSHVDAFYARDPAALEIFNSYVAQANRGDHDQSARNPSGSGGVGVPDEARVATEGPTGLVPPG